MFYASMNKGTGGIVFGLVVSACVSSVCVSRKVVTTIFHKSGALKTNMNRLDFEVQGQRSKVKVMIRPNNGQKGGSIRIDGSLLRSSLYFITPFIAHTLQTTSIVVVTFRLLLMREIAAFRQYCFQFPFSGQETNLGQS